ncbi:glycosyltransferase [Roseomonas sp. NAR14]|uniref:Glycosyltransferase n=1 Tax=Roseomonas acroporae TaxID=2937791 RepID=A0A9X2BUC4_9PROT|nr:glycosyltransferase [Roseomonas acroporae]MCK8785473.1 glycosyltransferase [Roseomonas acroporae]
MRRSLAIFTICSNNYVRMADILLRSAKARHPDATTYLCLADGRLREPDFYPAGVEVVTASELGIRDFEDFAFRYDIMELNTAVKPFMFLHLLARGHDAVLYFDPDIEIFSPLHPVLDAIEDGASFVLTPHLCHPEEGEHYPGDIGVMQAGVFNLGFLGIGACGESERLLQWWARRLRYQCVNDQPGGVFVDQKFMDLIPAYAARMRVLRDPTLNVAYWNLQQRDLSRDADGTWRVDGAPLGFFHFSGFNPRDLTRLSKYTTAFSGAAMEGPLLALCRAYADRLVASGHGTLPDGLYAYGRFASGTPIPEAVRRMYRERHLVWAGGDPFETYESFLDLPAPDTWRGAVGRVVTNLMAWVHEREPGLRQCFDLRTREGVNGYFGWYGRHALNLLRDRRLLEPVMERLGDAAPPTRQPPAQAADEPAISVVGDFHAASHGPPGESHETGWRALRGLVAGGIRVEGVDAGSGPEAEPGTALGAASGAASGAGPDVAAAPGAAHPDDHRIVGRATAPVALFRVDAEGLPAVVARLGGALRPDAYRIAMPLWALPEFPAALLPACDLVDEIWAPTRFVQATLVRALPGRPVPRMPLPLEFDPVTPLPRAALGLPEDGFLFLCVLGRDGLARRNPGAAIAAFRRAFRDGRRHDPRRHLVLGVPAGSLPEADLAALRESMGDDPGLHLVEAGAAGGGLPGLVAACDALLSTHRSEALGLPVAAALSLGRPAIATDYSATTELVSPATGYPVDFRLVPVREGEHPFHAGQVWAEADPEHAAWQMRRMVDDEAGRRVRVAAAAAHIRGEYGFDAVGRRQAERLRRIRQL